MPSAIKSASQISIGVETTPGTSVARTRRLMTRSATFRVMEEDEEFLEHMHGVLARQVLTPVRVRNGVEFEVPLELDFENVLLALLAGVKGDVTPTTPGTGEARLWTFEPLNTATIAPKTYTLEWVESDFTDNWAYLSPYIFATAFEVTGGETGVPTLTLSMVGRKSASTTKTTIAIPTLTFKGNLAWKLYLDTTWAGLGTTAKSGQVYGFRYRFSDFLRPEYYLDGRSDLDFAIHEFAPRVADLSVDMVVHPDAGKLLPAEITAKDAGDKRFIRLEITGAAFSAPDGALSRYIRIDGAYRHAPDSMREHGRDRNGNMIVTMHLQSVYDATAARDVRFAVQNNLATYP